MNFYRIEIHGLGEAYEWADTAREAIDLVRTEAVYTAHANGHALTLGTAIARPAVYKEWDNLPEQYTNGGGFTRR
jgi:hypothetical protein